MIALYLILMTKGFLVKKYLYVMHAINHVIKWLAAYILGIRSTETWAMNACKPFVKTPCAKHDLKPHPHVKQ